MGGGRGAIGYVPGHRPSGRSRGPDYGYSWWCAYRARGGWPPSCSAQIACTERPGTARNPLSPAPALTRREREAAELIATGLSDKEIARRLNISLATAKLHVHNLLGKLNVQRRGQVVARLHEREQQHPELDPAGSSAAQSPIHFPDELRPSARRALEARLSARKQKISCAFVTPR